MSPIIEATYNLIDTLDKSNLIKELTKYKEKLMKNKALLKEIASIKKETDNNIIIKKRQALYKNNDYKMYMKYYNELSLFVLRINRQYKKYTNTMTHECRK